MKYLLVLTIFFSIFSSSAQSDIRAVVRNKFPTFEVIYSYLESEIQLELKELHRFGLEKRIDGYHLVVEHYADGEMKPVNSQRIWSLDNESFEEVKLDSFSKSTPKDADLPSDLSKLLVFHDKYDFLLLYGYGDWSTDVVELLTSLPGLSAKDHEILARAYSHMAISYLRPVMVGQTPTFAIDFPPANFEKVSRKRKRKCLSLIEKSIKHWKTAEHLHPNHKPHIIEDLRLKIANEQVNFYLNLLSVHEDELALTYLERAEYPSKYIAFAKSELDNCPTNSFLFTNGDSDSFPLWFVQEAMNYRKDVVVMNTSLMQTDWYLSMNLKKRKYSTKLSSDNYRAYRAIGFYAYEPKSGEFVEWLTSTTEEFDDSIPDVGYFLLPEDIWLKRGENLITLDFKLATLWSIALLDIITSNPKREIMFTSEYTPYKLGLIDYSVSRGNLYMLGNKRAQRGIDDHSSESIKSFLKDFEFNGNSPNSYGLFLYVNLLNNISLLKEDFPEDYKTYVKNISAKVDYSSCDMPIWNSALVTLLRLCDKVLPDVSEAYRDLFKENALSIIDNANETNFLSTSSFESIYEIYSGTVLQRPDLGVNRKLNTSDNEVLEALMIMLEKITVEVDKNTQILTVEELEKLIYLINQTGGIKC